MTEGNPRVIVALLDAAEAAGALALRDLWIELAMLANGREFSASEACADAALPDNRRLFVAIAGVCGGEFGPRKLGKILAKWEGVPVASLRADCIGGDSSGILWRVCPTQTHTRSDDGAQAVPASLALPTMESDT